MLTMVLGGLGAIFNEAAPRCISTSRVNSSRAWHPKLGLNSVIAALIKEVQGTVAIVLARVEA